MTYMPPSDDEQTQPSLTKGIAVYNATSGEWVTAPLNDEAAQLLCRGFSDNVHQMSRGDFDASDMKDTSKIYVINE